MRAAFLSLLFLVLPISALSADENVSGVSVDFVYQQDLAPTEFEFSSSRRHDCGSGIYRVVSNDETIANRKFSLVLAAFTSGKKLAFHDTGVCIENRAIISWMRITN